MKTPTLYNKKTDWLSYQIWRKNNLELNIPLKTADDIESATDYITTMIQKAAWRSTVELEQIEVSNNFPLEVKKKIAKKRKLRRKWQQTRNSNNKNIFNRTFRELNQLLNKIKNEEFENCIENLTATEKTEYSLWKATKKFKRPFHPVPILTNGNGRWTKSDSEKAGLFTEHLSNTFQPHINDPNEEVKHYLEMPLQMSSPVKYVSPKEVNNVINNGTKG